MIAQSCDETSELAASHHGCGWLLKHDACRGPALSDQASADHYRQQCRRDQRHLCSRAWRRAAEALGSLTLNQFTYKSIPFDPAKDFDPITNAFINTQVLVVSAGLGVSSLDELAELSRSKPGTLSYSALAIPMQITMERWKQKTGADLVSVPSRGGGDIVTGLLTGTTPVAIVGLPNFITHIRSGTVKALAVDSDGRSSLFPDVPTLNELGFPNLAPVYFGFVAPAGTPKPIIEKLHADITRIGNEPAFRQKRITEIGLQPIFDTPEQFARYLKEQRTNAARLIEESGFQAR